MSIDAKTEITARIETLNREINRLGALAVKVWKERQDLLERQTETEDLRTTWVAVAKTVGAEAPDPDDTARRDEWRRRHNPTRPLPPMPHGFDPASDDGAAPGD